MWNAAVEKRASVTAAAAAGDRDNVDDSIFSTSKQPVTYVVIATVLDWRHFSAV